MNVYYCPVDENGYALSVSCLEMVKSKGEYCFSSCGEAKSEILLEKGRPVTLRLSDEDAKTISFTVYLQKLPHDGSSCVDNYAIGFLVGRICRGFGNSMEDAALHIKVCLEKRAEMQSVLDKIYKTFGFEAPKDYKIVSIAQECTCDNCDD